MKVTLTLNETKKISGSLYIPSQYLMDNVISLLTQLSDSQVSLYFRGGGGTGQNRTGWSENRVEYFTHFQKWFFFQGTVKISSFFPNFTSCCCCFPLSMVHFVSLVYIFTFHFHSFLYSRFFLTNHHIFPDQGCIKFPAIWYFSPPSFRKKWFSSPKFKSPSPVTH